MITQPTATQSLRFTDRTLQKARAAFVAMVVIAAATAIGFASTAPAAVQSESVVDYALRHPGQPSTATDAAQVDYALRHMDG